MLRRTFHLYWRLARGMTLGVRAVVLDGDNRVFLVKHSYVAGWHLPGGGVEVGESFRDALRRELMEEGRIELSGEPALHGLFFNSHVSRRDHVAVYMVRQFRQDRLPEAEPRDRRLRFLRGERAAGGDDRGYAPADIGSARRQGADRDLALGNRALCRTLKQRLSRSRGRAACDGKKMKYLKALCCIGFFVALVSNVWSISGWTESSRGL